MQQTRALTLIGAFAALFFYSTAIAQSPRRTPNLCDNGTTSAIDMSKIGDIVHTPCPGRSSIFNRNVSQRKFNSDGYQYGFSFDSLSNYDGTGETTNSYTEFNIEDQVMPSVYRNVFSTFNISTPNDLAAAIGMTGQLFKTGTGNIHDVQGVQGSSVITAGRVSSGIYGVTGSTSVVGGAAHGDVADLRVGASMLTNTSARSYSAIWISRPTINNVQFSGPVTALRVDDGLRSPVFTIGQTGQIRITNPETPQAASAPCMQGEIRWDANFVYVCVATDNWKRTSLASW
jgi:hypothetical protein